MNQVIKIATLLGVIILIALPLYYYNQLPDIIPSHFGFNGKPDDTGPKVLLWIMPAIGLFVFILSRVLIRYPHAFHYPVKITEENSTIQYKLAQELICSINGLITWLLLYMTAATIQTALGNNDGLSVWVMLIFFVLLFSALGRYMGRVLKYK